RAHRDVSTVDVVPQRELSTPVQRLQFPADVLSSPVASQNLADAEAQPAISPASGISVTRALDKTHLAPQQGFWPEDPVHLLERNRLERARFCAWAVWALSMYAFR